MAGSFDHIDDEGAFRFDLVENMRDAYQTAEEVHFVVWELAGWDRAKIDAALARYYRVARGEEPDPRPPYHPTQGEHENA